MKGSFNSIMLYNFPKFHTYDFICAQSLSHGQLFVITWTVARRAPWSKEFSRREYWSGLPCLLQSLKMVQDNKAMVLIAKNPLDCGSKVRIFTGNPHCSFITVKLYFEEQTFLDS